MEFRGQVRKKKMEHSEEETKETDNFALQVKKIEEEAEKIIADANREKEEIISEAKTKSVSLLAEKQRKLEGEKEEIVKKEKQKIKVTKKAKRIKKARHERCQAFI